MKKFPFGIVAAIYQLFNRIRLEEIINNHISKRSQKGLTPGQYIMLFLMARCNGIHGYNRFEDWYRNSVVRFLLPKYHSLSRRNCLNQLDRFKPDVIEAILRNLNETSNDDDIPSVTLTRFNRPKSSNDQHNEPVDSYGMFIKEQDVIIPFQITRSEGIYGLDKTKIINVSGFLKQFVRDESSSIVVVDDTDTFDQLDCSLGGELDIIGPIFYSRCPKVFNAPLYMYQRVLKRVDGDWISAWKTSFRHHGKEFTIIVQYDPKDSMKEEEIFANNLANIYRELYSLTRNVDMSQTVINTHSQISNSMVDNLIPPLYQDFYKFTVPTTGCGDRLMEVHFDYPVIHEFRKRFGKAGLILNRNSIDTKDALQAYSLKKNVEKDLNNIIGMHHMGIARNRSVSSTRSITDLFLGILEYLFISFIRVQVLKNRIDPRSVYNILGEIELMLQYKQDYPPVFKVGSMSQEAEEIFLGLQMNKLIPGEGGLLS